MKVPRPGWRHPSLAVSIAQVHVWELGLRLWDLSQVTLISSSLKWENDSSSSHSVAGGTERSQLSLPNPPCQSTCHLWVVFVDVKVYHTFAAVIFDIKSFVSCPTRNFCRIS